jgi:ESCRT-II complex subunit VPS36
MCHGRHTHPEIDTHHPLQGFPRARVMRALLATHNEHAQAALDWLLAAGGDPAMDAPMPFPEPAVVSRQELARLQQLQLLQGQQQQQQQQQTGQAQQQHTGQQQQQEQQQDAAGGWGAHSGSGDGGGSPTRRGPSGLSLASGSGGGPGSGGGVAGSGASGSRVMGVAGIMSREAEKSSATAASLASAFRDLDALMAMAQDMVALAERFRGVMAPDGTISLTPGAGSGSAGSPGGAPGGGGAPLLLDAETQRALVAMGISSPVTRASAGSRYHSELSRQLADFLCAPLARAGGVLMLPEVYCLFNRARATELVSPDDLLQAAQAFPQVGAWREPGRGAFSSTCLQSSQQQLTHAVSPSPPPTHTHTTTPHAMRTHSWACRCACASSPAASSWCRAASSATHSCARASNSCCSARATRPPPAPAAAAVPQQAPTRKPLVLATP